jgi:threonine synthase
MRYVSTRGQAPIRDFAGVLLAGLAEDGGLYVPQVWPTSPLRTGGRCAACRTTRLPRA